MAVQSPPLPEPSSSLTLVPENADAGQQQQRQATSSTPPPSQQPPPHGRSSDPHSASGPLPRLALDLEKAGLPRALLAPPLGAPEHATGTSTPVQQPALSEKAAAASGLDWASDPANALNWPVRRKWLVCLTVSVTAFMSTAGSSMAAPLAPQIGAHFGEEREKVQVLLTAIYVLGLGFGPFLYAPIAELYGRQSAYISSTLPYALFNAACIVAPSMPALIVLRFFAGAFASSGPALGIATVSDVFSPRERGTAVSIYAVGPMAGPVFGSMLGGWLSLTHWRWTFGVLSIISALNALVILLFMQETFGPVIQYKLAHRSRAEGSAASAEARREGRFGKWGWVVGLARERDWKTVFQKAFTRPFRFLLLNPVLATFACYYAFIYGCIYLLIVTLPVLFSGARAAATPNLFNYGWSPAIFPLCYFGLGVGFFSAATTAANAQNRIYAYLCRRNGDNGHPEYRLVLTQIGMIFFPVGWFIYGWTAHAETHWIGPLAGLALGGYGLMLSFNSLQNFVVDFTAPYSAAGVAGITFARSTVACLLPIYGQQMFAVLGWNWGGSLMAFLSLVALPAPAIMWVYGRRLRERFKIVG